MKIEKLRHDAWRKKSSSFAIAKNVLLLGLIILIFFYIEDIVEFLAKIMS
tara:strand:- start:566 stop:715 length:150 start_codon:yes stop_codon:yes gene_type:complete